MRLSPQVRTSMHRCIRRWGTARDPFQSMFYWAFIYDRYMSDICMPYHSAGRFLVCFSCTPLSGLPGLPSALVRFRPGLSTDRFGFGNWKATNSRLGPAKVTPQYIQILFKLHTVIGVKGIALSLWKGNNSVFFTYTSRKWAAYSCVIVIVDVSNTTPCSLSARRLNTLETASLDTSASCP